MESSLRRRGERQKASHKSPICWKARGSGGRFGTRVPGAKLTVNTNNQSARPIKPLAPAKWGSGQVRPASRAGWPAGGGWRGEVTGGKCSQKTLSHWQRETPLHSCFPAIVCGVFLCLPHLCLSYFFPPSTPGKGLELRTGRTAPSPGLTAELGEKWSTAERHKGEERSEVAKEPISPTASLWKEQMLWRK